MFPWMPEAIEAGDGTAEPSAPRANGPDEPTPAFARGGLTAHLDLDSAFCAAFAEFLKMRGSTKKNISPTSKMGADDVQ